MSRTTRRLAALAGAALTSLALVGAPAQAADDDVTFTVHAQKDHHVGSTKCRDYTFTGDYTIPRGWKMSTFNVSWYAPSDPQTSSFLAQLAGDKKHVWTFCPKKHTLGKYTTDEVRVYAGGPKEGEEYEAITGRERTFYVRASAHAALSAKRSGSHVTLTGRVTRFNVDKNQVTPHTPASTKAVVQVRSGKTWKTLSSRTIKNGSFTYTTTRASSASYRFTLAKTSVTTDATSNTVAK